MILDTTGQVHVNHLEEKLTDYVTLKIHSILQHGLQHDI